MKNSKLGTYFGIGIAVVAALIPVLAGHADELHLSTGALVTAGAVIAALGKALGEKS